VRDPASDPSAHAVAPDDEPLREPAKLKAAIEELQESYLSEDGGPIKADVTFAWTELGYDVFELT
jgi:hypothetical protein